MEVCMAKNLVIVESPAKAKTLKKFLGTNYKIAASVGHVRDLPKSYLGIDVDNDFAMKYMTIRGKKDVIDGLKKDVKNSDFVYLATDPDREGEAIAWHLFELLHLDPKKTKRITFNEITKTAVKNSIKNARDIDMDLVNAQQARRALDRIVGYKISPILWHKVRGGLSAGRVQSVAVKMICDREAERNAFVPEEYWTIDVALKFKREKFLAKFYGDSKKIDLKSKEDADKILAFIEKNKDQFVVGEVKKGSRIAKPYPPFTTSTLQQEASKLLGFATNKTMRVAQQLYEGVKIDGEGTIGLISYIRTDSVRVSDEAYMQAKEFILDQFGEKYLASSRPIYKSKSNAQDAHEAIRPTYSLRTPDSIKSSLTTEQFKLYRLIWQRFIASQMSNANYDTQAVKILNADKYVFKATGSVLKFKGYLAVYDSDKEKNMDIPNLEEGDKLNFDKADAQQHFTQPPARYTEAMLVKTLEELGIGRPSTYSAIITNIQQRGYVGKESKAFYPTELGEIVNEMLCKNFNQIVNINFTSDMELSLDKVADGSVEWKRMLKDFYFPFNKTVETVESKIDKVKIEDQTTDVICEKCGKNMVIKIGRYGKFLACPGFPDCKNAKPLVEEIGVDCPKCGAKVVAKKSRKGKVYYVCEKNPDCDFISWSKPLNEKCPECGSYMVASGKKKSCSNKDCRHASKN